ncbi:probable LRR receptor-like serine/threonine-protein kinase at3g47570 [Phtheirospermum japonicum]|uniref:non-specific serine/threonine protein kinase n=1 Tax=Phtheirospermum japonicum TaxID=374723 RepID=A0A830D6B3_9LAMI|nr:probable LRR receptor-like serine/threonine-protein kinase at3g47570 [Phtheirospermum japonicum]
MAKYSKSSNYNNIISCLLFLCLSVIAPSLCVNNDAASLLAFKAAIDDDPLQALSSWNQTVHVCSWKGVTCSRRHADRVVSINLMSQGLVGSLSPHLGNLSFLRSVTLRNNSFRGPIPDEIGRLRRLQYVENLIDNNLGTSFPSELGSLSKLQALGLSRNRLSGTIPPSIGNLTSLNRLSLANCGLEGHIPESLVRLQSLRLLQLSENSLTGTIPPGLFNISTIFVLTLRSNRLQGTIPADVASTLSNVRNLDLGENMFGGEIPVSLSNASSLEAINLSSNNFTGPVMSNFERLPNLEYFYLSRNYLRGDFSFISSLTNCTRLQVLAVSENLLNGSLPESIANLSSHLYILNVSYLNLRNNHMSGPIPSSIGELVNLRELNLEANRFTNNIPTSIGRLTLLNHLYLGSNNLSGVLPNSLGVFLNATVVSVDGNDDLCGGINQLRLHPCPSSNPRKKNFPKILIIILIPSVLGVAFLIAFILLYVFLHQKRTRISRGPLSGSHDIGKTTVAVKVLKLDVRGASKSLLAECNALRGIRHRNLVKLLSICDGTDFKGQDFKALIYEFESKGSLEKWLHQNSSVEERMGSLTLIERLNITIDIASALEYLHVGTEFTTIHGDIKPSNVLLDDDMTAHVGDFGLAKVVSNLSGDLPAHESTSMAIKGTIGYIPPEGDAYSYGILLLEIFTNIRPTNDALENHPNLHSFVSNSLPDNVVDIIDPAMQGLDIDNIKIKECMMFILSIGVACSKELATDRMTMTEVVTQLKKAKATYLAERMS